MSWDGREETLIFHLYWLFFAYINYHVQKNPLIFRFYVYVSLIFRLYYYVGKINSLIFRLYYRFVTALLDKIGHFLAYISLIFGLYFDYIIILSQHSWTYLDIFSLICRLYFAYTPLIFRLYFAYTTWIVTAKAPFSTPCCPYVVKNGRMQDIRSSALAETIFSNWIELNTTNLTRRK